MHVGVGQKEDESSFQAQSAAGIRSPFASYLSYSDAQVLRQCLQKHDKRVPERNCRDLSTTMKHLLAVNTSDGQDGFAIPALGQPFFEELLERALKIHETYLTTNEACLGKEIPGQTPLPF